MLLRIIGVLMLGGAATAWAAPPRIISLAPSVTELVYDAGAGDYLVGAAGIKYTRYGDADTLASVGDAYHVDLERVVALKPTLVLAWKSFASPKLLAKLRGLGYTVEVFKPRALDDIAQNIIRIGKLVGTEKAAQKTAQQFRKRLARLRARYSKRRPLRVFYEISAHPLYTINGEQIISEGIRLCGGKTIFADLPTLAASVSVATVIARNPQVIITAGTDTAAQQRLATWRQWPKLAAVKNQALFSVPADSLVRATPRMLDGIVKICEDLDQVRTRVRD